MKSLSKNTWFRCPSLKPAETNTVLVLRDDGVPLGDMELRKEPYPHLVVGTGMPDIAGLFLEISEDGTWGLRDKVLEYTGVWFPPDVQFAKYNRMSVPCDWLLEQRQTIIKESDKRVILRDITA